MEIKLNKNEIKKIKKQIVKFISNKLGQDLDEWSVRDFSELLKGDTSIVIDYNIGVDFKDLFKK